MFDFVREKKRLVQIVLAVIILPFAFWGVDSYNRAGNSAEVVATVNGAKISRREFDDAMGQQQEQLRQMMGANFDAAMLENPEMRQAVLESLVSKRLLIERAKKAGIVVTDSEIDQITVGIEAFQKDGKFDRATAEAVLARNNMNQQMFEARLREDMLRQQMRDAYVQNGFASDSAVDNIVRLNEQQRTVSVATIPFQFFITRAEITDEAVQDYYKQNQKEFQLPEQARVEYVKFSVDDLEGKASVAEEELRRYYDEHQQEFVTSEERRRASIIQLPLASKAQAEEIHRQAIAAPAKFAALAKQYSQDLLTASKGGDWGMLGKSMYGSEPLAREIFSLQEGDVGNLVETPDGYLIVKLTAIDPAQVQPYAAVREGIVAELRRQRASDLFAEQAEKFSNTVYEQSDTLKPAAELVGARVEQSGWLVKGAGNAAPWTEKMLQAVFSDEVVKDKRNTAAIEVATDTLVAARILEHKPASVRALDDVRQAIRQKLVREQAAKLAAEQGKATLAQLQSGDKAALAWSPARSITRARSGDLDAGLVRQVFQANGDKFPQYVGAESGSGYVLVRIDAVKQGETPDEMKRMRYAQQLRQLTGEELFQAYLSDAKKDADIELKLPEAAIMPTP